MKAVIPGRHKKHVIIIDSDHVTLISSIILFKFLDADVPLWITQPKDNA